MGNWAKRYPRLSAIGGVVMLVCAGLATLQGIWGLFSSDPLFSIASKSAPLWGRFILIGVFALVTAFGLVLLVKVFKWTKDKQFTDEQKELLDFYERQKENWKSSIRLQITRVIPNVEGDIPKVTFELEVINHLPIGLKLVKVTHSSGTVSAGGLGSCNLPALPETIDKKVGACSEKQFSIEMEVKGTKVADFLTPKLKEPGQLLQWMLKGEWYVEIYDEIEVWQYQSHELRCNQVIVKP